MTTGRSVVVDASPLIALSRIGHLQLLERLYGQILLPAAVAAEVGPTLAAQPWLSLASPAAVDARILAAGLGPGETEAIALALERIGRVVILDDEVARRLAAVLGLPTIGTVGVLVEAKTQGHIPLVRPALDALLRHRFCVSPALCQRALRGAGEAV